MISKTTNLFYQHNAIARPRQCFSWPEARLLQTWKVRTYTKTSNAQTAEGHPPNIALKSLQFIQTISMCLWFLALFYNFLKAKLLDANSNFLAGYWRSEKSL